MEAAGMKRREAILADVRLGTLTDTEVARQHGVSRSWVGRLRRRAGIPRLTPPPKPPRVRSPKYWTDDQIAYLIAHPDDPIGEVAAALGRPIETVYDKRYFLAKEGRVSKRRVPYTEAELALLADPQLTDEEVARRTGRSVRVIADSRRQRGIRGGRR
jgi:transposase